MGCTVGRTITVYGTAGHFGPLQLAGSVDQVSQTNLTKVPDVGQIVAVVIKNGHTASWLLTSVLVKYYADYNLRCPPPRLAVTVPQRQQLLRRR